MIGVIFMFAGEMLEVRVNGNDVIFRSGPNPIWATIEGLQLSKAGVIKEFPDLKDQVNWKEQAIERFKDKIAGFSTEQEKVNYIIEDLKQYGYVPKYTQKGGHRPQRIK